MPRRTWDAKTTAMIVIEGLKGKPVEAICTAPKLCQAQDDRWRDQILAHAAQALEGREQSQRNAHLARETARLQTLVGGIDLGVTKQ